MSALKWSSVWEELYAHTGVQVEKRAIMEALSYLEDELFVFVDEVKCQHEEHNKNRIVQGLPPHKRIRRETIEKAIKQIKEKRYEEMSDCIKENQAGGKQKEDAIKELHPPQFEREVA